MVKDLSIDPVSIFSYWRDGGTLVPVNMDPPTPEEAKPFFVLIRDKGYIPMSILVFARDETHALSRVRASVQECMDKDHRREPDKYGEINERSQRLGRMFLDAIDNGTMFVEVKPMDMGVICAKVNWSGNGGVMW